MKINLIEKINEKLEKDEVNIELQYSSNTETLQHFIKHINNYEFKHDNKVFVLNDNYTLLEIKLEDIIIFYSDKKYNYCKVKDKSYRIKSKLYELEKKI